LIRNQLVTAQLKFYKIPFVLITLLLILGIEFRNSIEVNDLLIFTLLVVSFLINFLLLKFDLLRKIQLLFYSVSIVLIGVFFLSTALTENKNEELDTKSSRFVEIIEIGSVDRVWRKALVKSLAYVSANDVTISEELLLLYFQASTIKVGDQLLINSRIEKIENKGNPGEFDAVKYWATKKIYSIGFVGESDYRIIDHVEESWLIMNSNALRNSLSSTLKSNLDQEQLGVGQALILGNKELLSTEIKTSFSRAGAMHVLAVSGLHVGIVLAFLIFVLERFPRIFSRRAAILISILFIWIYAGITGFSPSVLRATIMFSIIVFGDVFGKQSSLFNSLGFSAFLMIVWNPLIIYDIGFQLSYLAMLGIFLFYAPISKLFFVQNKHLRKIWNGTAVGIAAQITTVPLTLYYFHQFPNYFALTNIGMMIFAGLTMVLGLLLFALNWLPYIGAFVGIILGISLSIMIWFVSWVESLPGSVAKGFVISEEMVLIIYGSLMILILFRKNRKVIVPSILSLILLFSLMQYKRYSNLKQNELVVFNSNDLIVSVKIGNKIFCFHDEKDISAKRTHYLMSNYQNVKPGKLTITRLKKGSTTIENGDCEIELIYNEDQLNISNNQFNYTVRTSYKAINETVDTIIDLPFLQKNPSHIQLSKGAFVVPLNNR